MRGAAGPASLGEKTMQAADEADEPVEAMRGAVRPARLVEKIMRNADEADEPVEAMRGAVRPARLVKKIMRAADEAYEPKEAKRAKSDGKKTNKRMKQLDSLGGGVLGSEERSASTDGKK